MLLALGTMERKGTRRTQFEGRTSCLGPGELSFRARCSLAKTVISIRGCRAATAVLVLAGLQKALRRGMPPSLLPGTAATAIALTPTSSATRAERA